eukprot:scaffold18620_cov17-Prasinocladus_malaysianus.AAC.1
MAPTTNEMNKSVEGERGETQRTSRIQGRRHEISWHCQNGAYCSRILRLSICSPLSALMVPLSVTESGITLWASPASNIGTDTTADPSGDVSRDTSVCSTTATQ